MTLPSAGVYIGLDPGRSKCGLARTDASGTLIVAAAVLPGEDCWRTLQRWCQRDHPREIVLGDGTGSAAWHQRLTGLGVPLQLVPEAGTTLAARQRYWQLEPPRGWRRWLPEGLRLPPRDVDDVVAQLLLEQHLQRQLRRTPQLRVRTSRAR